MFENGIDRTRKVHLSDIVQSRSNMLDKKYYTKGVYFQEKLVNLKEKV